MPEKKIQNGMLPENLDTALEMFPGFEFMLTHDRLTGISKHGNWKILFFLNVERFFGGKLFLTSSTDADSNALAASLAGDFRTCAIRLREKLAEISLDLQYSLSGEDEDAP